jgi:Serine dehydrogenase proteinase
MTSKPEAAASVAAVAQHAAEKTGADIYLYNGPIRDDGYAKVLAAVGQERTSNSAILLITTYGGDATAAYRIARWFQTFYQQFSLFPTGVCASAGTLLAIGANKLYMSPFSELGPLDVQLFKRNELGERKSGLVTKAALNALQEAALEFWEYFMLQIKMKSYGNISFDKCADIASSVCGPAFAEMYKQIDPSILGADDRDMKVAQEYGERLAEKGQNIAAASIARLVNDYPSHDFVIDFKEAKDLFEDVELPPSELTKLVVALSRKAVFTQTDSGNLIVERLATAPEAQPVVVPAPVVEMKVESGSVPIPTESAPEVESKNAPKSAPTVAAPKVGVKSDPGAPTESGGNKDGTVNAQTDAPKAA